jgi:hypothetical protein
MKFSAILNFNHFKFVEKSINIYYIKEVNYEDIFL